VKLPNMKLLVCAVLVVAGLWFVASEIQEGRKNYTGYQIVDIEPKTFEAVKYLRNLMLTEDHFDFWTEPAHVGETVTVMVSPLQFRRLQVLLRKNGIQFEKRKEDVQSLLEPMWAELDKRRTKDGRLAFDIDNFNEIDDIYAWLATTVAACPSVINCQVRSIGNSFNGRPLLVFSITSPGTNRKGFWIDATIHAREWIATSTALKLVDTLARRADSVAVELTNRYDWHFLAVVNPDGYAYTHTNDRLWRKNRRPNAGSICYGTDLNRNFDWKWGTDGVSTSPCSEIFCGPSAGSEVETQAVSNELKRLGPDLLGLVTLHSYGQMFMFPWGTTVNHAGNVCERTDDHDQLMVVANSAANAIQGTYGTSWDRGNSCEVIYETSGSTGDYGKGVAGIKYAFTPELRGNNFIIAASNIPLSFFEIYHGIIAMVTSIEQQQP